MLKSTSPGTQGPDRPRLRFPKASRLREVRDFTRVREHGKAAQGRFLRIGLLDLHSNEKSKVGLITSRRVGKAVTRNKVRRRLRELARMSLPKFPPGFLIVVIAKPTSAKASFEELRGEWLLLARRLSILPHSS